MLMSIIKNVTLIIGVALLCSCASTTTSVDDLRKAYQQLPVSVRAEISCDEFSEVECDCVRSNYNRLIERPDDETLIAAADFMRKSGLNDPTSDADGFFLAITMQPMAVLRAKKLCSIPGDLQEADDAVQSLSINEDEK